MNYTSLLHTKNRNYTPSIDLYFQQELGKNQTFLTNVVATYISSDYFRNYQENNQNESLYNYSYNTDGKKQTLQAEAIYENRSVKLLISPSDYALRNLTQRIFIPWRERMLPIR